MRDIPIKTLPCRVQKMERLASDVMALHLRLPANERLPSSWPDSTSGSDPRRQAPRRAMANAPHDDEHFAAAPAALHRRHLHRVSSAHARAQILRFEGPFGTFFLRGDSDKPIVFLASGTKASLRSRAFWELPRSTAASSGRWCCTGAARTRADLYLDALPRQWAAAHPNFRYVPVLSEARPEEAWTGRTGFVHQAVMEDLPDLSAYHVYACGAPVMVEAAHRDFTSRCRLPGTAATPTRSPPRATAAKYGDS
ncbi:MAG: hypothetical protein U1E63_01880 [Burkholderiales bacterium]